MARRMGGYDPKVFAMLRGAWPRVTSSGVDVTALEAEAAAGRVTPEAVTAARAELRAEAVTAQVEAGLDLISDGQVSWADPIAALLGALAAGDTGPDGMLVRTFHATAALTDATVAAVVPGPYTLALRDGGACGDLSVLNGQALAFAASLAGELAALRAAGCAVVIIDEPAATGIGAAQARDGWIRAHRRLLREPADLHLMLAVPGGDAHGLGGASVFGLPYASVLVDLIEGPDNWYLVREAPGSRGVVCAALAAAPGRPLGDQSPQLVWAAQYAASINGRGLERVGLANASSLASLTPAEARAALDALAVAARYAVMTREEAIASGFDERAWRTMPARSRPRPDVAPSAPDALPAFARDLDSPEG